MPFLGRQPIDSRRQHRLHRRRDLKRHGVRRQGILPAPSAQDPRLDQRPHPLLQEEGIALGPLDQQAREGGQARVIAEQSVQELVGTGRRQRIEAQLRVVALLAPTVLILAPVRDEQQQARPGQALDQAVQQRLGLGVEPVQVLHEQEQGALAGFPQQQPFHGVEGALAALGRLEPLPRGVLPGTSSRASSAGSTASSEASRARSLPVTFARISSSWSCSVK